MAAAKLEVPVDQLSVEDGTSRSFRSDQDGPYGELVDGGYFHTALEWNGEVGNGLELKGRGKPKSAADYRLVGTEVARKDVPGKVMATLSYAHHMVVPGMMHGRMVRPPVAGAVPVTVNEDSVQPVWGAGRLGDGFLGVVADHEWDAIRAAEDLEVTWSEPEPQLKRRRAPWLYPRGGRHEGKPHHR